MEKTGIERALELIEECKRKKSDFLNLGSLGLTEIPNEILECRNLKKLDLGWYENDSLWEAFYEEKNINSNKITDISILKNLTNLTSLNLSKNIVTDISVLKNLTRLTSLNLSETKITDISILINLTELDSLDLSDTNVEDILILKDFKELTSLTLKEKDIRDISFLKDFEGLKDLNLSYNRITDISILKDFKELTHLQLSQNYITDISPLNGLENLSLLYLKNNKITNISYLNNLTKLKHLDLSYNRIKDISYLKNLPNLTQLILNSNQIADISGVIPFIEKSIKSSEPRISISDLISNPIKNPPPTILGQGIPAILRYFKQLQTQGKEKIHEARILIVGEGKAGKTTLVKKFLDVNYPVPTDEDETVGIQITEGHPLPYPKDKSVDFRTHIWDFGGQEIQYMTHQFFLTPDSLYVLVVDDREESTRLPYWFHTIRLLGSEHREGKMEYSPVLVVLNKKKGTKTGVNYDALKYDQNFPDLKKIVRRIDFKNDTPADIEELNRTITKLVCQLPIVGREVPKQWKPIRVALREEGQPYISLARFREICRDNRIEDPLDQDQVSWYLHKLGYIIHFQEEDAEFALTDTLILQPKWALTAIYRLLLHEDIKQEDGIFTHRQMTTIWADYLPKEQDFLLKLMLANKFDLVLPLDGRQRRYIAPVRLSKAQPKFDFAEKDALRFRYDFKFMPEGIITRLIVREGQAIKKNAKGKRLVWKTGVVLEDARSSCTMLVKEGLYPQQIIDILITGGNHAARVEGLGRIRTEIDKILRSWFENAQFSKIVPCNCDHCLSLPSNKRAEHEYDLLWEMYQKGVGSQCKKSFQQVPAMKLLKGVDTPQELSKHQPERFGLDIRIDNREVMARFDEVKQHVSEESVLTRENTDRNTEKILAEIPMIFRKELAASDKALLAEIFEQIEKVQVDIGNVEELVGIIGEGVDAVFKQQPTNEALLKAFQEMTILQAQGDSAKFNHKLKVSLPLIPLILKYEGELSGDIFRNLKERWRQGGWKRMFLEDVE